MKRLLIALLSAGSVFAAQSMTLVARGSTVYAGGPVNDDLSRFQEALELPGIKTVVFVNSPGGDLWTGMRVARLIASRGLDTVIAGTCLSACSIMFMAGRERSFADTFRPALTFIGIHGAHNRATRLVDTQLQPAIYAFYKQQMGERFNSVVINQALYDMDDAGSMLRIFDAQRTPARPAYHCRSEQSLRKDCTTHPELDALSLGIVTRRELSTVDLPDLFKPAPMILGQRLTELLPEGPAPLKKLSDEHCASDRCRDLVRDFDSRVEHKALAVPLNVAGLGYSARRDTLAAAFVGALYECNHVKDKPPRLCEAQVVDGFDVSGLYAAGEASHSAARERLTVPDEPFYSNEQFGGVLAGAGGFRAAKLHDATPRNLEGIKTFGTQELARALTGSLPPVLVDVAVGSNDAIPGAVTLLFGGFAFDDAQVEQAYQIRFGGLLRLLGPDLSRPIVFYGQGRDYWQAVNAALRARKLGYTQVGWYRGGLESWKAAGLPLALVVVRAVAN